MMEFLGFIVNTVTLGFRLPPKKADSMVKRCSQILGNRNVQLWVLASLLGEFTWASSAVPLRSVKGEIHPLCSVPSFRLVARKLSGINTLNRDFRQKWSSYCWEQSGITQIPLIFWLENLVKVVFGKESRSPVQRCSNSCVLPGRAV